MRPEAILRPRRTDSDAALSTDKSWPKPQQGVRLRLVKRSRRHPSLGPLSDLSTHPARQATPAQVSHATQTLAAGVWLSFLLALIGCQSSIQGDAKAAGKADTRDPEDPFSDLQGDAEGDAQLEPASSSSKDNASNPNAATKQATPAGQQNALKAALSDFGSTPDSLALMGARHDLYLRSGQPAVCTCLAVAAGLPSDSRFGWESVIPEIDPKTQRVIAFSSHGQECDDDGPSNPAQAAYRGYTKSGNDVIVMIEAASGGRPAISGAIIPRPTASGKLLIQSARASLPFGKAPGGSGPCHIELNED